MVNKLISLALRNRVLVLLLAAGLFGWGVYSLRRNPIDAIPDLSENQVIVFTEWSGRSPSAVTRDEAVLLLRGRVAEVVTGFEVGEEPGA